MCTVSTTGLNEAWLPFIGEERNVPRDRKYNRNAWLAKIIPAKIIPAKPFDQWKDEQIPYYVLMLFIRLEAE